jgi:predicted nucleic acid-binding protein
MIILDTNVVSEPTKLRANPAVLAWIGRQERASLYLTAINLAEVMEGVELLPNGKRKSALRLHMNELLIQLVSPVILPFDREAAMEYASLVAFAKTVHYTLGIPDAQIAAIARVHGFTVATRDVDPFRAVGIPVINPWET